MILRVTGSLIESEMFKTVIQSLIIWKKKTSCFSVWLDAELQQIINL